MGVRVERRSVLLSGGISMPSNAELGFASVASSAGISVSSRGLAVRKEIVTLTNKAVTIPNASDFAGLELITLPNSNLLVLGASIDLTFTSTNLTGAASTVDFALGSVVTASAAFTNAGEDDYMEKVDATGASSTGAALGHSFDMASPALIFRDGASNNKLFLNIAGACTVDAVLTISGEVAMFWIDLGEPA